MPSNVQNGGHILFEAFLIQIKSSSKVKCMWRASVRILFMVSDKHHRLLGLDLATLDFVPKDTTEVQKKPNSHRKMVGNP